MAWIIGNIGEAKDYLNSIKDEDYAHLYDLCITSLSRYLFLDDDELESEVLLALEKVTNNA